MKRKIVSVLLALLICVTMALSVGATSAATFVVDDIGYLAHSEVEELNEQAAKVYAEKNIGVFFLFTTADPLSDYDLSTLVGGMANYFVMMENESSWNTFAGGVCADLDETTVTQLRDAYDVADTYVGGVADYLTAASELLPTADKSAEAPTEAPAEAPTEAPAEVSNVPESFYVLFDDADLLSAEEETAVTEKLTSVSSARNAQIVVATVPTSDGVDVTEYAEHIYDTMEFGFGENKDGVLLLVCMDPREYRIVSNGFAGEAITTDDISAIGDLMASDLSGGYYADAFDTFANEVDYYLNGYTNGFGFDVGGTLLIALPAGLIVGLIVALVLKGQLKSVRKQEQASVYVRPGSMQVSLRNDMFLYRNVTRTKKETSSSSGSGGGGSSRSVGGGSF